MKECHRWPSPHIHRPFPLNKQKEKKEEIFKEFLLPTLFGLMNGKSTVGSFVCASH